MATRIDRSMPKEISQVFARRVRLSSKAIFAAVVLTVAGLIAIAIAAQQESRTSVENFSPVSHVSTGVGSMLMPAAGH